jgi:tripartite-type tricarboxylate transporter receptor subunit TctC
MRDLLGGHIDMMVVSPDASLPQVRVGKIEAYAITARSRLPPRNPHGGRGWTAKVLFVIAPHG